VFGFFLEESLSDCVCVPGAVWLAACLLRHPNIYLPNLHRSLQRGNWRGFPFRWDWMFLL